MEQLRLSSNAKKIKPVETHSHKKSSKLFSWSADIKQHVKKRNENLRGNYYKI